MNIIRTITDVNNRLRQLSAGERVNIFLISFVMFLLLFSYPMIRASSESILLTFYGAKAGPYAWIYSVIALSFTITFFNKFQMKWSIHRLFLISSILTTLLIVVLILLIGNGFPKLSYGLYVLKEVYIVVLVHATLGYLNVVIDEDLAKIIYGPLGAIGSLGGILGGLFTSGLIRTMGINSILLTGAAVIFACGFIFTRTDKSHDLNVEKVGSDKKSPLASVVEVKNYVFLIVCIVVLSQFCINLTHHKFNIYIVKSLVDKTAKAEFLGKVYAYVNMLAMFLQFFVIPFVFRIFPKKWIHMTIPLIFILTTGLGMGFSATALLPVAAAFVVFKGVDYSLFSAGKELLYFSLDAKQKYGAKYITDMVAYRFAKGLISLVLIFVSTTSTINALIGVFLVIWAVLIFPLFKCQPHGETKNEQSSLA